MFACLNSLEIFFQFDVIDFVMRTQRQAGEAGVPEEFIAVNGDDSGRCPVARPNPLAQGPGA